MTRKEATRRLEQMALQHGHKRKHYIKRALVEFLENREPLMLPERGPQVTSVHPALAQISPRLSKFPN